ncbi:hypothetical protein BH09PLA1_BH09PLA1_33840 [soil metagenome]
MPSRAITRSASATGLKSIDSLPPIVVEMLNAAPTGVATAVAGLIRYNRGENGATELFATPYNMPSAGRKSIS